MSSPFIRATSRAASAGIFRGDSPVIAALLGHLCVALQAERIAWPARDTGTCAKKPDLTAFFTACIEKMLIFAGFFAFATCVRLSPSL
jgi:hypothetical protein